MLSFRSCAITRHAHTLLMRGIPAATRPMFWWLLVEKKKAEETTIVSEKSKHKRVSKIETDLKDANMTMQWVKMQSMVILSILFMILMGILNSM